MKNPIGAIPARDLGRGAAAKPNPAEASPQPPTPTAGDHLANTRLVIEQDGETGVYVYKSLDRITGEVLRQFPREEVVKMLTQARYSAGDVIKTRA